jgi:hypothetical protein
LLAVLTGVLLIAAGIAIELTGGSFLAASRSFSEHEVQVARQRNLPRWYQKVMVFNAWFGPRSNLLVGRLVGLAAIVAGIVFLISG